MQITITNMQRQSSDGLVTQIDWVAKKEDGGLVATMYGSSYFSRGDDFIPYDQVTESIAMGWLSDKIDRQKIEEGLDFNLSQQRTPPVLNGVPWVSGQ